MKKIHKRLLSSIVVMMMAITATFIPGLLNFNTVRAEGVSLDVEVELNIGNNNNLISGNPSNGYVKDVDSTNKVATITSPDGKVVIEITDWDIKQSGNDNSTMTIKVTGVGATLKNISISASQSQSGGGDTLNIPLIDGVAQLIEVGNKLNFFTFKFDVYTDYTLTYMIDGEVYGSPVVFNVGDEITPPAPTQEGFTFNGWFDDDTLTTLFEQFDDMPAGDRIVYGTWIEDTVDPVEYDYFFHYNYEGATEHYAELTFTEEDNFVTPPVDPSREGFDFLGWNTKADGSGDDVTEFDELDVDLAPYNVYAQWAEITVDPAEYDYFFHYNYEGATEPYALLTFTEEDNFVTPPANPTRENFVFDGWNTKADGSGDDVTEFVDLDVELAPYNVYAQWAEIEGEIEDPEVYEYYFHYNFEGATEPYALLTFTEEDNFVTPPANPTRENFVFDGWNTKADGSGDDVTEFVDLDVELAPYNVYAQWAEVKGDEDEIPDTSDSSGLKGLGLLALMMGLLMIVVTRKKEEEEDDIITITFGE